MPHAQHISAWSKTPLAERCRWINGVRARLAASIDPLAALIEEEIGKPRFESLTADIMPVLASMKWHAKNAQHLLADRRLRGGGMIAMGQSHTVERRPLGHVAIIATWNYPVGLLGVQLIQSLIAGNRVTVKPSEHAARTQEALIAIFGEGLPEGTLTAVEATREAGRSLLADHAFDHVVFTGSTEVGTAVAETLAPSLTPSTLELSGRDSAFVLADADTRLAAESIWFAGTSNAGQTCMAPRRMLVEAEAYPQFIRWLGMFAAGAQPRRLVSSDEARRTFDLVADAIERGGRSVSSIIEPPAGKFTGGVHDPEPRWLRPVAVADCPEDADLVAGRHFGPAFSVIPVRSIDHALEIHHRCDQHLATSIFTARPAEARRTLVPRLDTTTITLNNALIPTAHPAASIGGIGASGWGESQGVAGLLAMTRAVTVSDSSTRIRPPLAEPTADRLRMMTRWIARLHGAKTTEQPLHASSIDTAGKRAATSATETENHATRDASASLETTGPRS